MLGYVLQAKRKNAGFDICLSCQFGSEMPTPPACSLRERSPTFQKVISWPPKIHTILVSGRGHRKLDTRNVRGCDSNSGG